MWSGIAGLKDRLTKGVAATPELAPTTTPEPPPREAVRYDADAARPDGCILWCHAASVDQAGALVALAQELARLRGDAVHALLTSDDTAPTPAAIIDSVIRLPAPTGAHERARRFLEDWTPDVAVFLDDARDTRLLAETQAQDILLYFAATERGLFAETRRATSASVANLPRFDACLAPSAADAQAMRKARIDPAKLVVTGPLSDTALALPIHQADFDAMQTALGGRPVWLAARITMDEVAAMDAAQRRTIRAAHRLLLVVVPRDMTDGPEIASRFSQNGWRVATESKGELPSEMVQVFVADQQADLSLWYRLAPISVLGGTFDAQAAATDPFEAAALGSAILHGPEVQHAARFKTLKAAQATAEVATPEDLGDVLYKLMSPEQTAQLAHAGWSVTTESAHVVEKLATMISDALDEREFG